jgi:hypothetical protein
MGFGSYDESEQGKRDVDAEVDDSSISTNSEGHDGAIDYKFEASNDELLDRLKDIKEE